MRNLSSNRDMANEAITIAGNHKNHHHFDRALK
jgi:hypothetical protein